MDLSQPRPLQRNDALFLDVDGTLVPIARRPEDVIVAEHLPEVLTRTAAALDGALALISGRTIATVDDLVQNQVKAVAGIHGLERRTASGVLYRQNSTMTAALGAARKSLAETVNRWPRAFIEHKGLAFAIHYRLEPAAKRQLTAAAEAAVATSDGGLKLIAGDCVLEVMVRGADKGTAVRQFLGEPPFKGRRPVYVGDDMTDETAFRMVEALDGITVIVGERRPTAARHALRSVDDVHRWIGALTAEVGAVAS